MPQKFMNIIKYDKKYKNQVLSLHRVALDKIGARVKDENWEKDLFNIEDEYFKKGGIFLLAIENTQVIAMGALKILGDDIAEICRMRVDPNYQNKGIGNDILKKLENHAKKEKVKKLLLSTTTIQKQAIHFYEKNNYKRYKYSSEYGFKVIHFKKNLSK